MEESTPSSAYTGKIQPPYTDEVSTLRTNSAGSKAGKIFYVVLASAFIWVVTWFVCMLFFWRWSAYAATAVALYFLIGAVRNMLKSQCALCPYCGFELGSKSMLQLSLDDKNLQFACDRCFEWLLSDGGKIRAFREADINQKKEFDCPVVANGVWPNECMVCGAPPTRHLNARTFGVGLGSLLVGRLSVSYGSVKNIPYCETHKDAVTVKNRDNKLWAVFENYSARRRYLYVNKLYLAAKAKG